MLGHVVQAADHLVGLIKRCLDLLVQGILLFFRLAIEGNLLALGL